MVIVFAALTGYVVGGVFIFLWLAFAALELTGWPTGGALFAGFATATSAATLAILLKI